MKNNLKFIFVCLNLGSTIAFGSNNEISVPFSLNLVVCNTSENSPNRIVYLALKIEPELLSSFSEKTYYNLKYQQNNVGKYICFEKLEPLIIEASMNNGNLKAEVNVGEKVVKHFVCTEHGSIYTGCKNGYYEYETVEDIQVKFSSGLTMSASYN